MQSKTFTIEQIQQAHGKVKSGADFPAYIREIRELGVTGYTTYVSDSHTDYEGVNGFKISSKAKYDKLAIADRTDAGRFKEQLKAHQEGKTDYPAFCNMCAACGIDKWMVSLDKLTCTYYDKAGNQVFVEGIPV